MKKFKLAFIGLSILGLVACNSGSESVAPTPEPTPTPDPKLESLPYSYSTNYTTGQKVNNLPVIDLLPLGASASITFTFTNPYTESSIWFVGYRDSERFMYGIGQLYPMHQDAIDLKFATPPASSSDCRNYTNLAPLPPGQSCTLTQEIIGVRNGYNSEDLVMLQQITYGVTDTSIASGVRVKFFTVDAYAKTGIWYKNLPNYNIPFVLNSFHVINESGSDYMYQTRRTDMIGKVKMNFDESGVAILNYSNTESCTLNGCVNGIIPVDGYNIILPPTVWTPSGNAITSGGYDAYDHANYVLLTLDNTYMDRTCLSDTYCPTTVFSQVFAVQPDGTIVGKNRNGTFGCSNRDGSNYRTINLPEGIDIKPSSTYNSSPYTITYGQTNWVFAYKTYPSGYTNVNKINPGYFKVNANTSGLCKLENDGALDENSIIDGSNFGAPVDGQMQITPHGVYGFINFTDKGGLSFYKYLPREYMRI